MWITILALLSQGLCTQAQLRASPCFDIFTYKIDTTLSYLMDWMK